MKQALYYEKLGSNKVHCRLCPNECVIQPGNVGICLNRKNVNGELYTTNYGRVTSVSSDPIEKKPLYHFYPGASILSLGTSGCSMKCDFCQNSAIAQSGPEITQELFPEASIALAKKDNFTMIAYTYNEPFIWFEHVLECSKLAKQEGIKNVLVTNGYYNEEPFFKLLEYTDAMNIDLKAFNDDFYKKYCNARIEPVKRTIKNAAGKTHIEITTLIIPGLNDSEKEISRLVDFIADINPEIPYHISRYYPRYKRTTPATSEMTLRRASEIAKNKLKHVYVGNMGGFDNNTYCSGCNAELINRNYYLAKETGLKKGECKNCGKKLQGEFSGEAKKSP